MEELKKIEGAIKRKDRTQDDIIKYLLESKKQTIEDSYKFAKSEEFQVIRRKLKELNKS
jgi:hypothetical protein